MAHLSVRLRAPNGVLYDQPTSLFINNDWVVGCEGTTIDSINPTNGSKIVSVHAAGAADVDTAVVAARNALNGEWGHMDPTERSRRIHKLANLIEENAQVLATVEAWNNGKVFLGGVERGLGRGDWNATILRRMGRQDPWPDDELRREQKLGPALACGNTVVLKPAEQTPLSALLLGDLVKRAAFPAGVINIVNGLGQTVGAAIAKHHDIDKVAFTGSTHTGREVMRLASSTLKNITLETGGKSPLLVLDDADLEQAAKWAHYGIMSNQGQICTATSRVLVHETVMERFMEMFSQQVTSVSKIGDPFDDSTFQGPQISQAQLDNVLSYVDIGKEEGATLALGGKPFKHVDEEGFFVHPTVFTDVDPSMRIFQEEIFGPFCVITIFKTVEEAVQISNNSAYGLGSAVFTRDVTKAHTIARQIRAGTVWINSCQDSDWRIPFGGVKQSGVGRELGDAALEAYTSKKSVHVNLGNRL